jgi:serine phosphatase RsbU (regulator of sigma subunit)
MLAGGIVLPRFRQKYPSLFSHGLLVSIVPLVAGQFHAAFGRPALIVNHVNIALLLKILAYLVPLAGLVLDYVRAHQSEFLLRTTEEKLKVARRLQLGLLPQRSPEVPGFDLAGASLPADAVGGDYFDYVAVPAGRTGIVVADVSGHELGAALLLAQTRAYLRALAGAGQELEWTVGRLNEFLVQDVQHRWFVTMFYLELDPTRAAFRYAAAGHEAYVLRGGGEVERLRSTSPPLGVLEGTALACGPEVLLAPGDVVLVTTDGITEAHDRHREMFGVARLHEVVAKHRARPAREIVDEVLAAVAAHTGGGAQLDDMTVVVAKCLDSFRRT